MRVVHLLCGLAGASLVTLTGLFVVADAPTPRALLDGALVIAWATLLIAPAAVTLIRADLLDEDRSHSPGRPWSRTATLVGLLVVLMGVTTVSPAWREGAGRLEDVTRASSARPQHGRDAGCTGVQAAPVALSGRSR